MRWIVPLFCLLASIGLSPATHALENIVTDFNKSARDMRVVYPRVILDQVMALMTKQFGAYLIQPFG